MILLVAITLLLTGCSREWTESRALDSHSWRNNLTQTNALYERKENGQ